MAYERKEIGIDEIRRQEDICAQISLSLIHI